MCSLETSRRGSFSFALKASYRRRSSWAGGAALVGPTFQEWLDAGRTPATDSALKRLVLTTPFQSSVRRKLRIS
jgi:hypothetical protein